MKEGFFRRFLNKAKEKSKLRKVVMKEESMKWGFTCGKCSKWSSIWESGGIRHKAKGEPRMRIRCPKCNKASMQKVSLQKD